MHQRKVRKKNTCVRQQPGGLELIYMKSLHTNQRSGVILLGETMLGCFRNENSKIDMKFGLELIKKVNPNSPI